MHFARIAHTTTFFRRTCPDCRWTRCHRHGRRRNIDPATNKFTVAGSMLTPLQTFRGTSSRWPRSHRRRFRRSRLDRYPNSAEIYDPRTHTFTPTSPLHDSRFKLPDEAVQLASGRLLIAGGSKTVEVYDPEYSKIHRRRWPDAGPRHFMSETKLPDGSVLLTGGYPNNDRASNECEKKPRNESKSCRRPARSKLKG